MRANPERRELIKRLRDEGKTYDEIAVIFGMTRQAVHQYVTGYRSPYNRNNKQLYKLTSGQWTSQAPQDNSGISTDSSKPS